MILKKVLMMVLVFFLKKKAVLARLSAGVYWSDMEDLAVQILCNKLTQIGILIGDQDELIRLGIPYAFYFHSMY